MKRVLIAGNCDDKILQNSLSYIRAVYEAGALAVVGYASDETEAAMLSDAFDALLLPGGNDLPGGFFGQTPHPACSYDHQARDLSDKLLLMAFLKAGKRVLGICRGCQVANVYLGGTLHQHLPDAYDPVLWHSGNITGRHKAEVLPDSLLSQLIGAGEAAVNSSHHQAIAEPGQGLRIVAKAPDGVIEAAEGENILLLQWHPERMTDTMLPVFTWLVGA